MFSRGCEASASSSISSGCAQVAEGCGFVSASNLSTQAIPAPGTVFHSLTTEKPFRFTGQGQHCRRLYCRAAAILCYRHLFLIKWVEATKSGGLLTVPNQRSIAPHPYAGVSIQSTLSPWAGCSSGALSLHGAVGLAHSPGRNLKGQSAPPRSNRSLLFRLLLLT